MKNSKIWKTKSYSIDINDVLDYNIRIATVTGGFGDFLSGSIWDERYVEVWLRSATNPVTIWGKDGEKFINFYKKNK